jgi:hypothetical protein
MVLILLTAFQYRESETPIAPLSDQVPDSVSIDGSTQGYPFCQLHGRPRHRVQRLVSSRPGGRCEFSDSTDWEISQPGEG